MINVVTNQGIISERECHCRGRNGNDLQMMNTDGVTNYGTMTTRKCQGERSPQTVKINSFINYGILVLHKCGCNSDLVEVKEFFNYGTLIVCRCTCKACKPKEAPDNSSKIGEYLRMPIIANIYKTLSPELKEPGVPLLKATPAPLDLSISTGKLKCPEKPTSSSENLTIKDNVSILQKLLLQRKDLKSSTTTEITGTEENPPKKQCLAPANNSIDHFSPQNLGSAKASDIPVQKTHPHQIPMCTSCAKDFHEYVNDPKNAKLKQKTSKLRCSYCLNSQGNKTQFNNHMMTCQQEQKPYQCLGCPYKSTRQISITVHSSTCFNLMTAKLFQQRCLLNHCRN
ncbi:hypothetical protein KR084_001495 [Drosophila pseudotakahashii]|nr:hypothetical protein KR084_001495 [Drosophila pseudotakahashii]